MDPIQVNRMDGHDELFCQTCNQLIFEDSTPEEQLSKPICCKKFYNTDCYMPLLSVALDRSFPEQGADDFNALACPGCNRHLVTNSFMKNSHP